eukprot:scaffold83706_cov22-Tisochrysis_lutea.AAC.1
MPAPNSQFPNTAYSLFTGVFGGTPAAAQGIISAQALPLKSCLNISHVQGRLEGLEILFHKEDLLTLMRGLPVMPWLTPHPDVGSLEKIRERTTHSQRTKGNKYPVQNWRLAYRKGPIKSKLVLTPPLSLGA